MQKVYIGSLRALGLYFDDANSYPMFIYMCMDIEYIPVFINWFLLKKKFVLNFKKF